MGGFIWNPGVSDGGSSFDHLIEDGDNSWLAADWPVLLSPDNSWDAEAIWLDPSSGEIYSQTSPGHAGLTVAQADDTLNRWQVLADGTMRFLGDGTHSPTHPMLRIDPDGSLHWGDGTAAPSVDLVGDPVAEALVSGQGFMVGDTTFEGAYAGFFSDGTYYSQDDEGRQANLSPQNLWMRGAAPGAIAFQVDALGDTDIPFSITNEGLIGWGSGTFGTGGIDTSLSRLDAGVLGLGGPELVVSEDPATYYSGGAVNAVDLSDGSIILQRDSGDAVTVKHQAETFARVAINHDGSLDWSDGTLAPDTSMERAGESKLRVHGILQALSDTGYISFDPGFSGSGSTVDLGALAEDYPRLSIDPFTGEMSWSDGANPSDVQASRRVDGSGDEAFAVGADAGAQAWLYQNGKMASYGASGEYAVLNPDGSVALGAALGDVVLGAAAANILGIDGNGGGLQIKSPNGTAYNLTATDDGTLDLTAA